MTAPETIFVTADVDELADTIDLYAQITPEVMTGKPERYTRADLCIRRDDPVLVQVMEALDMVNKAINGMSCGNWIWQTDIPSADARVVAAIAAMQELIGGNDGQA